MPLSRHSLACFKVCANCGRREGRRVRICARCFPPGDYRKELRSLARHNGKPLRVTVWREPENAEVAEWVGERNKREALIQTLAAEAE